jgi:hypothetical protein
VAQTHKTAAGDCSPDVALLLVALGATALGK